MNNGRKEYIFLWYIENYSYCWHKRTQKLVSPKFNLDGLGSTSWVLWLYPKGSILTGPNKISLFLAREGSVNDPKTFPMFYELSYLASDGSVLCSGASIDGFEIGLGYGILKSPQVDEVLLRRKADYLPQDTLTVRCRIWKEKDAVTEVEQFSARTRIGVKKLSFLHKVENFSGLQPNEKKTINIRSPSNEHCNISSILYVTDCTCSEEKIISEIVASDENHVLLKRKISLLDVSGNILECCDADSRFDANREDIQKLPLSLTRRIIQKKKSEYLPNDELSLICECTFSTGVEFDNIEEIQREIPLVALKQICKNGHRNNGYNASEKLSACPTALDDLKAIHNNQFLADTQLKTKTKSFPAHKNILCARSSVFKVMLTNDMKEKNTDCIQIDDLDDDTVQKFLLFLYSDFLQDLEWDSAIKLYYAGDKYAIEKLKIVCASYLVDNLSTSNVTELLLLADTHSDFDLKKFVEDFILENEEEVFGSDEWDELIETNPQLVIKTMHLKYKRSKEGK